MNEYALLDHIEECIRIAVDEGRFADVVELCEQRREVLDVIEERYRP